MNYENRRKLVTIICKIHGKFQQTPNGGKGCRQCWIDRISKNKPKNQIIKSRYTQKIFIEKAIRVHGSKYNYEKVVYKDSRTKIDIICPKHGLFSQSPTVHLGNHGCKQCGIETIRNNKTKSVTEFIKQAKTVHGDKYDYSISDYVRSNIKITITCKKHGKFKQIPSDHLNGFGCKKCGSESASRLTRLTQDEFIEKAINKHGNKYDYSKTIYEKHDNKIKIVCLKHGEFEQKANSHLNGGGCRKCRESKGEKAIRVYLEKNYINFESQVHTKSNKMIFDFMIKTNGLKYLIEYNGIQHYEPCSFSNDKSEETKNKNLKIIQKRDSRKIKFCKKKKYPLLIIPHWEYNNIDEILNKFIDGIVKG